MLNYNHLRYFHAVALEGHLTRAAERLNLSQSALSAQIKTLEDRLGHKLFERVGRSLELTEVGRITLDYADRIFGTGDELLATLAHQNETRTPLRVGAVSTLSRNFQIRFLDPVLGREDVDLVLRSGTLAALMTDLRDLAIDVVLTTEPPSSADAPGLKARKMSEQPVVLHGTPERLVHPSLKALLAAEPVILPAEPAIRRGFDALVTALGVAPRIAAEVDDMAMVRLLAREGKGLALAPSVVFVDEINAGRIAAAPFATDITETFYSVTVERNFPHPLLQTLLKGDA